MGRRNPPGATKYALGYFQEKPGSIPFSTDFSCPGLIPLDLATVTFQLCSCDVRPLQLCSCDVAASNRRKKPTFHCEHRVCKLGVSCFDALSKPSTLQSESIPALDCMMLAFAAASCSMHHCQSGHAPATGMDGVVTCQHGQWHARCRPEPSCLCLLAPFPSLSPSLSPSLPLPLPTTLSSSSHHSSSSAIIQRTREGNPVLARARAHATARARAAASL
eukprot:3333550-Rhodomonas_salina.1